MTKDSSRQLRELAEEISSKYRYFFLPASEDSKHQYFLLIYTQKVPRDFVGEMSLSIKLDFDITYVD